MCINFLWALQAHFCEALQNKSFSTNGNPGINTLVDALDIFGLELQVKAIPAFAPKTPVCHIRQHRKPFEESGGFL